MLRVFLSLLLCACAITAPNAPTDTTYTIPLEFQARATAPGGTNRLDIDAVAPGGNNNLFVRGSAGSWISLRDVPFTRKDTLIVFVSKALPPSASFWFKPVPTWFYISTVGGVVLMPGTNWGEGGAPRWDAGVGCCIVQHGVGAAGNSLLPGEGRWEFGGGGSAVRDAQHGMIRVRFYSR